MSVAAPFGVISNRIRETSYRFQLEMHDLCLLLLAASKGDCLLHETVPDRTLFEIQMLCDDSRAHKVQNDNDDDRVNVAGDKQ